MSMYFDLQPILTMQYYLNIIVGSRRIGKSFKVKKFIFNRAVRNNENFVYMRRYTTECTCADMITLFDDLWKDEVFASRYDRDKLTYKQEKNVGYWYYDKKVIGMCLPLSKGITKKSVVNGEYYYLLFDEFLIPKGLMQHYINNEVKLFLDTIGTFTSVGHDFKKIFLLANNMSFNNPYFNFYKIPVFDGVSYKDKNRSILVFNAEASKEFKEAFAENGFAKIIQGTSYGEYFTNNKALEDTLDNVVAKYDGNSLYNFYYKGFTLTLYNGRNGLWFSNKNDDQKQTYFITKEDNTVNTMSLYGNRYLVDALKRAFQSNNITYQNVQIKSLCFEMFDILGIK